MDGILNRFKTNPSMSEIQEFIRGMVLKRLQQTHDPSNVLCEEEEVIITTEMLNKYPYSPTAKRYREALDHIIEGLRLFSLYEKNEVDNSRDCDNIQRAFHEYSFGCLLEGQLYCQRRPPKYTEKLAIQYLKIKPNDYLVEYFKVMTVFYDQHTSSEVSHYEMNKLIISTGEEFISRLLPVKNFSTTEQKIVIDLYYKLGAMYAITEQTERALDSFQKCYDVDHSYIPALYGIAYHYMGYNADKAITLLHQFIEKAPMCDKQYPNAQYLLSWLYFTAYRNERKAQMHYYSGEMAEKGRLDFLGPVDVPFKDTMRMFMKMRK